MARWAPEPRTTVRILLDPIVVDGQRLDAGARVLVQAGRVIVHGCRIVARTAPIPIDTDR
jgi:hypothetical protein